MNEEQFKATACGRRRYPKGFAMLLALIACCLPTFGQTIHNQQLSSLHVPKPMRERFIERFKLFVDYEKSQSYDKQFDLLAKDHLATLLHMKVDRKSYVKHKQESEQAVGVLFELTVKRINRNPNNREEFVLSVIAKLKKGERRYSDTPICVAYLVNGDWRFSLIYVD